MYSYRLVSFLGPSMYQGLGFRYSIAASHGSVTAFVFREGVRLRNFVWDFGFAGQRLKH